MLPQLQRWLQQQPAPQQLLVAYSGGRDSHILLHALAQLRSEYGWSLSAMHVNHQLSSQATAWQQHCQHVCQQLQVHLHCESVAAQAPSGESPEAYARELRYQVFSKLITPGSLLVTAHYQSDQAETVLLNLLRGSGSQGLAAIAPYRDFAAGALGRPLLDCRESEMQQYAQQHSLHWVEDASNQDLRFDRNFIRHQVLPLLAQRWPGVEANLARVARLQRQQSVRQSEQAAQDLASVACAPDQLSLPGLLALGELRQAAVLRYWLQQLDQPLPSEAQLDNGLTMLLSAREDAAPCWSHGTGSLRRYRQRLYWVTEPLPELAEWQISWDLAQPLLIKPLATTLVAQPVCGQGLAQSRVAQGVTVCFRRGSERLQVVGRQGRHSLKKLFQEAGVPPWLREQTPLLFVEQCLVAVVGYWLAEGWQADKGQPGWHLALQTPAYYQVP